MILYYNEEKPKTLLFCFIKKKYYFPCTFSNVLFPVPSLSHIQKHTNTRTLMGTGHSHVKTQPPTLCQQCVSQTKQYSEREIHYPTFPKSSLCAPGILWIPYKGRGDRWMRSCCSSDDKEETQLTSSLLRSYHLASLLKWAAKPQFL